MFCACALCVVKPLSEWSVEKIGVPGNRRFPDLPWRHSEIKSHPAATFTFLCHCPRKKKKMSATCNPSRSGFSKYRSTPPYFKPQMCVLEPLVDRFFFFFSSLTCSRLSRKAGIMTACWSGPTNRRKVSCDGKCPCVCVTTIR